MYSKKFQFDLIIIVDLFSHAIDKIKEIEQKVAQERAKLDRQAKGIFSIFI